ncbi:sensor histidine kinase [Anaerobutyricum hallii]|nr:sensor histidine kinase [Anaerobutyricum hallii]
MSVSDDGCGFKNIDIEKATLPFYKSSKDIATEHLGLGLNISKILSERHGGNIQIANNKAGGACVTVKINCNES